MAEKELTPKLTEEQEQPAASEEALEDEALDQVAGGFVIIPPER